jgi:hypothetical protein
VLYSVVWCVSLSLFSLSHSASSLFSLSILHLLAFLYRSLASISFLLFLYLSLSLMSLLCCPCVVWSLSQSLLFRSLSFISILFRPFSLILAYPDLALSILSLRSLFYPSLSLMSLFSLFALCSILSVISYLPSLF